MYSSMWEKDTAAVSKVGGALQKIVRGGAGAPFENPSIGS